MRVGAAVVAATAALCTLGTTPASAETQKVKPSISIRVDEDTRCTLGFVFADSAGLAFGLTAKHCGDKGDEVTTERGTHIGTVTLQAPGDTDVEMIAIDSPLPVYTDVDQIGKVAGIITHEDLKVTRPLLCKKGARTGLSCGPLITAEPGWFSFAAQTDHGDSGAPVYALTRQGTLLAAGILEGSNKERPGEVVATPVAPFLEAWELRVP